MYSTFIPYVQKILPHSSKLSYNSGQDWARLLNMNKQIIPHLSMASNVEFDVPDVLVEILQLSQGPSILKHIYKLIG